MSPREINDVKKKNLRKFVKNGLDNIPAKLSSKYYSFRNYDGGYNPRYNPSKARY